MEYKFLAPSQRRNLLQQRAQHHEQAIFELGIQLEEAAEMKSVLEGDEELARWEKKVSEMERQKEGTKLLLQRVERMIEEMAGTPDTE